MLRTALLYLLLIYGPVSLAQDCSMLRGQIIDAQTREPLPGASIRSAGNLQHGITADGNGSFEFGFSKNDTLITTFIGYEDKRVAVSSNENCFIKIQLQAVAKNIQEIEIKAERIIAEEFTIRKIKKLDIYTNPGAKADPILAVNSMPSATTIDESANISLRGSSPAETGIFLNNVPINDAVRYSQLNGIGTFSIFNTALVNNVQVYPGNPPLEYGNSTSGLIALQTDEIIPEHTTNTIAVSLASVGFYSSRKLTNRSSLTLFTNYQPSAFIRAINAKALKDLKHFSSLDLGMHYFLKLRRNGVIKIFNYSLRESYKFHYPQPSYDGIFSQFKLRNFTVSNIRKRIGNTEISFNQGISFSKAEYNYGITNIDLKLHDVFSSFNIHKTGKSNEWKTGISYDRKVSDFKGAFPRYEFAVGENHPVSRAVQSDHIGNPEWYAYAKQYIGAKFVLGGGIRKNIAVEDLKDYLSLQANLNYRPKEEWKINLAAGRYYKYQLPEGETSDPELIKSNQYSLDINYLMKQSEGSLSLFYKTSNRYSTATAIKGIELFARHKINNNLRFQVSLTSLNAVKTARQLKAPSNYNIHYFLRSNVEYKISGTWTITTVFLLRQGSYHHPVVSASYNDMLAVYEPVYATEPERLPDYSTIDLSISKIFLLAQKSTAVAFLSAGNVINAKNVRDYTYNADYSESEPYLFSQRTIYFGIVINYQ